jgi:CheY-like chemotaxis protein
MLSTNLSSDQQSRVRTIQQHAMRIASIVTNLQSFARTSAAQLGVVRVDEVVDYALDVTRPRMRTVNVRLQVLGTPDAMLVLADRQRLSQVFVNLLNNACDAMDNSGTIEVALRSDEQSVTVDVRDRGRGIPPEHADKVFTPFFTTKEVGKGSGLGLSVSYGIVKEYGGQIRVDSPPGGGALFRVTLPRAASPAVLGSGGLVDTPAPHSVASRKGTVVAIVDDEPVIRDLVGTILGDEGYEVHAFPDAREALDHLRETRPDLVITDLRMPGMDGLALRDELIAREPRLLGRVIITTGLVEHAALDDPNHLPKPFTRAQLLGAVRQCLAAADEDAPATWSH